MNTKLAGGLAIVAAIMAGSALRQRKYGPQPVRRPLTITLWIVASVALVASIAVATLQ